MRRTINPPGQFCHGLLPQSLCSASLAVHVDTPNALRSLPGRTSSRSAINFLCLTYQFRLPSGKDIISVRLCFFPDFAALQGLQVYVWQVSSSNTSVCSWETIVLCKTVLLLPLMRCALHFSVSRTISLQERSTIFSTKQVLPVLYLFY